MKWNNKIDVCFLIADVSILCSYMRTLPLSPKVHIIKGIPSYFFSFAKKIYYSLAKKIFY